MEKTNEALLNAARDLARTLGSGAILVYADALGELSNLALLEGAAPIILVARTERETRLAAPHADHVIRAPDVELGRLAQINVAALLALSRGLVQRGDTVIGLAGSPGTGVLDAVLLVDIDEKFELLPEDEKPIGDQVKPPVFARMLKIATELAANGREGKPVGALFVVGDIETVLVHATQFVINPFKGYDESERNIMAPELAETVKEFSVIDGAFLVRGNGVIVSAGTYLHPSEYAEPMPSGLGARHAVAAAITKCTQAIAIAISESSGTTRIFRGGRILMEIEKPAPKRAN